MNYTLELVIWTTAKKVMGLRYFNVFAKSPKGAYAAVIPLFIDALSKNESLHLSMEMVSKQEILLFVENAVQANIDSFYERWKSGFGEVFNVALGDGFTLKTFLIP